VNPLEESYSAASKSVSGMGWTSDTVLECKILFGPAKKASRVAVDKINEAAELLAYEVFVVMVLRETDMEIIRRKQDIGWKPGELGYEGWSKR